MLNEYSLELTLHLNYKLIKTTTIIVFFSIKNSLIKLGKGTQRIFKVKKKSILKQTKEVIKMSANQQTLPNKNLTKDICALLIL